MTIQRGSTIPHKIQTYTANEAYYAEIVLAIAALSIENQNPLPCLYKTY